MNHNPKTRFLAHVDKDGPVVRPELGPCWLWTGALASNGYGQFGFKGHIWKAHRVAWALYRGLIPDGKKVLHKCDTRKCVRPVHLFIGTQRDNVDDMVAKGRTTAKLTAELVIEIRSRYVKGRVTMEQLANKYGVTAENIGRIIGRKRWRHI